MALRFCDSFDHYNTSQILNKWTAFNASINDAFIDNSTPRTGAQDMAVLRNGIQKTIDNQGTWIIGGACNWNGYGGGFGVVDITVGQVFIILNGDGTFSAFRGPIGGGTFLGRSDPKFAVNLGRYYYLEVKFLIGASGSVTIHLNSQEILKLTGVNTDNSGNGTADVIRVFGPGGGSTMFLDDFYVCDGSGSANIDFLNDVQIGLIMPASDGDLLQWTPDSGGVHFSRVNEIPPDGDASYVSDATVGDIDCYHFQTVDTTRSYKGIQTNITARKDDSNGRALSLLTRIGGINFVADPVGRFVNNTYIDYLNQFDVNPATGVAWTGADINGAQWGEKTIA